MTPTIIWGNPLTVEEQVDNPFGYSGEYWDATTELQYLRTRWYDPGLGRFIQEDSFEGFMNRPSSLNAYTYVENNPLRFTDPMGM
ncbi:RHS repeat-associated core domain-containing protein, partial [Paenibacillus daejeonensis]|uniref:RHS repeat-associated core domain-containing protein n=1 Tax=Paenibacillus daejeonensis TaxID=135193 RepID=UPI0012F945D4